MKKAFIFVVKLAVTLGLIYWVAAKIGESGEFDPRLLVARMQSVPLEYLLWAGGLLAVTFVLSAVQWWILLGRMGVQVRWVRALRLYFVGLFFNNFLVGNIGGDVKKVYDLHKSEKALASAVTATLMDRVFGLFVINGISLIAGLAFYTNDPRMVGLALPSSAVFMVMIVFFVGMFSRRFAQGMIRIFEWMRLAWVGSKILSLHGCFQRMRSPVFLSGLLVLSTVIQGVRILVQWVVGMGMGLDVPIEAYFLFVPLIGIVTALPISIGGFGPRELVAQNLFARVGVSPLDAVALQLVAYLLGLACSLLGALEFIFGRNNTQKAKSTLAETQSS